MMMSGKKRAPFEFYQEKANQNSDETPDFIRNGDSDEAPGLGMGTENIGPDDVVWLTRDSNGRLEVRLPRGYEQYSPFDYVLLAIIRAHPKASARKSSDANERERMGRARKALFGKSALGQKHSRTDDEILLKVARQVLEAMVSGKGDAI